jgi:hypothetical protein
MDNTNIVANPNTGRSEAKERIVIEAGFDPAKIPAHAWDLEPAELRVQVLKAAARKANFSNAESAILVGGHKAISDQAFKAAIGRLKAGVHLLPKKLREALEAGTVVRTASLGNSLKALGNLRAASGKALVEAISGGNQVIFHKVEALASTVRAWEKAKLDVKSLLGNSWTAERIILEAAKEASFTAEKVAALLPKAKLDESKTVVTVKYGDYAEMVFDFGQKTIAGRRVLAWQYGRYVGQVSAETVIGLFALSLVGVTRQSTAQAKLFAAAPSLFEEAQTGYGAFFEDSRHAERIKNRLGVFTIRARQGRLDLFDIKDSRSWELLVEAGQYFLAKEMPVTFDQRINAVYVGNGARSLLVGLQAGSLRIGTDAGKLGKLFARGKLAAHAIAEVIDRKTGKSLLVPSGLAVLTDDGRLVRDYGVRKKVAITNSTCGFASGVAIGLPGDSLTIAVNKAVRGQIDALNLTAFGIKRDKGSEAVAVQIEKLLKTHLKVNKGTVKNGDAVFSFDGIPYGTFRDPSGLMEGTVIGEPEIKANGSSESASISAKVRVLFDYSNNKYTVDGIKMTVIEYHLEFDGLDQPEITITCEEIKGQIATVRAWADNVVVNLDEALTKGWVTANDRVAGSVVYDPNTGLSEDQKAAMANWVKDHVVETKVKIRLDRRNYNIQKAVVERAASDAEYAKKMKVDPSAYSFDDKFFVVEQKITALVCDLVVGVEISTVPENITNQPIIAEELAALKVIHPELGKVIWQEARSRRVAVGRMLQMARGQYSGDSETLNLNEEALEFDKNATGDLRLREMAEKYPSGLRLVRDGKVLTSIDFKAVLEFGAILGGGSATGMALTVLEIMNHIHKDAHDPKSGKDITGWEFHLSRLVKKLVRGARGWAVEAKNSLGSVTRTGNLMAGRKVKTTCDPVLGSGMVGINPTDPIAKDLCRGLVEFPDGKFDPEYLEGMILDGCAVTERVPAISVNIGRIMFTSAAPVGMLLINALDWAQANEGDGDGDPSAFFHVKDPIMAEEILKEARTSLFGKKGYDFAHPGDITDQPYAEFFAGNAAKGELILGSHTPVEMDVQDFVAAARKTGNHYGAFMGKTFAMSSYLVLALCAQLERRGHGNTDPDMEKACVLAWRRLYEGMALSGCSEDAVDMLSDFQKIVRNNCLKVSEGVGMQLLALGWDVVEVRTESGAYYVIKGIDALRFAWMPIGDLEYGVAKYLYQALMVTGIYSLIESESNYEDDEEVTAEDVVSAEGRGHLRPFVKLAIIFGMLRRGGKGLAVSAPMGEEHGNGIFRSMTRETLDLLPDGMIKDMAHGVWFVQNQVAAIRDILKDEENGMAW